jgi:exonuclease III
MMTLNITGMPYRKLPLAAALAEEVGAWAVMMQETHTTPNDTITLETLIPKWTLFCEHGTSSTKGVAILIKNEPQLKGFKKCFAKDGRIIGVSGTLKGAEINLYSIYAPAEDYAHTEWMEDLRLPKSRTKYLGGDLNADIMEARKNAHCCSYRTMKRAEAVNKWMEIHNLHPHNPSRKNHTYYRAGCRPSTLDYWISNQEEESLLVQCRTFPESDHKALVALYKPYKNSHHQ